MPFQTSEIKTRLLHAQKEDRLAHAYLITGHDLHELENLFYEIASSLIQKNATDHPDVHLVQPESKSRRIRVKQIRNLERQLQLRSHDAPLKIAGILAADRMCVPPAEAANAFLKTLEEPPDHSIIFLLTDRPTALLPTIFSRCLHLSITPPENHTHPTDIDTTNLDSWINPGKHPADNAYKQAAKLTGQWRKLHTTIHTKAKKLAKQAGDTLDEDAHTAQIESDFLHARDQSLAHLIRAIWIHADQTDQLQAAIPICEALEELRFAISRNLDPELALERTCLKIYSLI